MASTTISRGILLLALSAALLPAAAAHGRSDGSVALVPSRIFNAGTAEIAAFAVDGDSTAIWTSQKYIGGVIGLASGPCGGAKVWDSATGKTRDVGLRVPCQDLEGLYLGLSATTLVALATYAPPMSADEVDDVLWVAGRRPPTHQVRIDATTTTGSGGIHSFAVHDAVVVHDRWNEPESGPEAPIGLYRNRTRIGGHASGHILSFDGKRLLVLTPSSHVLLLGDDGARLHAFGRVDGAALDGDSVVTYAKQTLSVWSASRGTLLRHWRVAAARGTFVPDDPAFLSGQEATVDLTIGGGYAAFFPKAGSTEDFPTVWHGPIWLVRLSDGRARQVTVANAEWPATVRLDAAGLFARSEHSIAFVPLARIAAAFR